MNIQHDFHIHTVYSSDASQLATVENYVNVAKEAGLKKIGFAEHFWDGKIQGAFDFYKSLTYEHFLPVKEEVKRLKNDDLKLYFGCEVEYSPALCSPAITEETAEKFEFILVPHSHSHETMPKEYYDNPQKHTDFIVEAYNNIINSNVSKYITAMAHPFGLVRCPYPRSVLIDMVSDDTFKRMFDKTAQKDIAIEINTSSVFKNGITRENIYESDLLRIFETAKGCGCKFIFGSDAHHTDHIKRREYADSISEYLGLKEENIAAIAR